VSEDELEERQKKPLSRRQEVGSREGGGGGARGGGCAESASKRIVVPALSLQEKGHVRKSRETTQQANRKGGSSRHEDKKEGVGRGLLAPTHMGYPTTKGETDSTSRS